MKLKKILVGAVVTSMIFTNSLVGFANNESVYDSLLNRIENVLGSNSDTNAVGAQVYLVKSDVTKAELSAAISSWLSTHTTEAGLLEGYGLTSTNIDKVVDAMLNELPSTFEELTGGETVISQMYNDYVGGDKDFTYSEYKPGLVALADNLFSALPLDMRAEMEYYTKDNSVERRQVVIEILNEVLTQKIGTMTQNAQGNYTYSYGLDVTTKNTIINKLTEFRDGAPNLDSQDVSDIAVMGEVFYSLADAALDAVVASVDTREADFNELMKFSGLLKVVPYTSPDDGDDDSAGGATTPTTPTTPDSDLSEEDQEKLDEVEDQLPEAGEEATDAQLEAAKDAVDELLDGMDLETAKDADVQVEAVAETVGRTLEVLDGEAAAEVAGEFADLVGAALENPNVSVEEQQEMVENAIENTFSKLASNKAASAADLAGVKEEIATLAETVVKNAATLNVLAGTEEDAVEGLKAFELSAKDLASTLKNAVATQADFVKSLEANGLKDVAKMVEKNINLSLPEVKATEQVSIKLDAEAAKSLGDSGVGVTVEAKGVNFKLPAALMQAAKSGLSVASKPVTKADNLNQVTDAGKMTNLKTVNVSVENGKETVKGMVELSFSLADLKDVDLDTLAVGVFEEGQWTKLDYTIENGMVTFTAPHFSIYSLMTFAPSFTDVEASWANKYITSLTARGVVSGKSSTSYDPNGTLTRAEFTTMLVKHLNLTNEVTQNFNDVSSDEWYYTYIGQAGLNSLVVGVESGNFMPNDAITREDMAVMMYRAYKLKNGFNLDNATTPFSDNSKIAKSAREAVYAVRTHGIISGYPDNTFRPEANATRAEAAAMIYLFLNK